MAYKWLINVGVLRVILVSGSAAVLLLQFSEVLLDEEDLMTLCVLSQQVFERPPWPHCSSLCIFNM